MTWRGCIAVVVAMLPTVQVASADPAPCHVGDLEARKDADLAVLRGVTCMTGSLELTGDVKNLAPLKSIRTIDGNLRIGMAKKIASLKALDGLERVTGSVSIGGPKMGVPKLRDIDGLNGLVEIGGSLRLAGGYIFIPSNSIDHRVTAVSGLRKLRRVVGGVGLWDVGGFRGLNALVEIGGDLEIAHSDFAALSGFSKLEKIGGALQLDGNAKLRRIDGLGALTEIGGDVLIGCPNRNDVLSEAAVRKRIDKVTVKGTFKFVAATVEHELGSTVCN